MELTVRVSGDLARLLGAPRITAALTDDATVADLLDALATRYPDAEKALRRAIPVVAGTHATPDIRLAQGREIALLTPVAGGKAARKQ